MTPARLLHAPPTARPDDGDDDTPLLALHCSGAGGRAFDGWRRRLTGAGTLLTPDLMGSGAEPVWPLGAATSLAAEAARVAALLPPGGVHVFGHSYGGAVALELARHWPGRVRSLTLYEPVRFALLDDTPALWRAIVGVGRRIGALTLAGRATDAAELFVDYWSGRGRWAATPAPRQAALALRMSKVQAEFEALFSDRLRAPDLAALDLPVHLLTGETSPAPALRVAERLAEALPSARLTRLRGLGHMGPLEDPAAVTALLPSRWAAAPALAEAA
jgi:pimeloyl-ACP methyl ester carboxylesterase